MIHTLTQKLLVGLDNTYNCQVYLEGQTLFLCTELNTHRNPQCIIATANYHPSSVVDDNRNIDVLHHFHYSAFV